MVNGVHVVQNGGQMYSVYTPQGIQIAQIFMGSDNQIFRDAEALKIICKVLARRWGCI